MQYIAKHWIMIIYDNASNCHIAVYKGSRHCPDACFCTPLIEVCLGTKADFAPNDQRQCEGCARNISKQLFGIVFLGSEIGFMECGQRAQHPSLQNVIS